MKVKHNTAGDDVYIALSTGILFDGLTGLFNVLMKSNKSCLMVCFTTDSTP